MRVQQIDRIPTGDLMASLTTCLASLPDPITPAALEQKLDGRPRVSIHLAHDDQALRGCLIGYELRAGVYYCWLSTCQHEADIEPIVALHAAQIEFCQQHEYERLMAFATNDRRYALVAALLAGFDLIELQTDDDGDRRLVLEHGLGR